MHHAMILGEKSGNIRLTARREENLRHSSFRSPQSSWPNADTHRESGFFYAEA